VSDDIRDLTWAGRPKGLWLAWRAFRKSGRTLDDHISIASTYVSYANQFLARGGWAILVPFLGFAGWFHARIAREQGALFSGSADQLSVLSGIYGNLPWPLRDLGYAYQCAVTGVRRAIQNNTERYTLALLYADQATWSYRLRKDWGSAESVAVKVVLMRESIFAESKGKQSQLQYARAFRKIGALYALFPHENHQALGAECDRFADLLAPSY